MKNISTKAIWSVSVIFIIIVIWYSYQTYKINSLATDLTDGIFCWFNQDRSSKKIPRIRIVEYKYFFPEVIANINRAHIGIGFHDHKARPPHFGIIIPHGLQDIQPKILAWSYWKANYWEHSDSLLWRFSSTELEETCRLILQNRSISK